MWAVYSLLGHTVYCGERKIHVILARNKVGVDYLANLRNTGIAFNVLLRQGRSQTSDFFWGGGG